MDERGQAIDTQSDSWIEVGNRVGRQVDRSPSTNSRKCVRARAFACLRVGRELRACTNANTWTCKARARASSCVRACAYV